MHWFGRIYNGLGVQEMMAPGVDGFSMLTNLVYRAEGILASLATCQPTWEALNATNEKFVRACDQRNRLMAAVESAPNEFARINLTRKLKPVGLKVTLLNRQLDRQFQPLSKIDRELKPLIADLKAFPSQLPPSSELLDLMEPILDVPLVHAGGWTSGPPAYVERSLSKLLDGLRKARPLLKERKPEPIGKRLRATRTQAGDKQQSLANDFGCSPSEISRIESGLHEPRKELATKIEAYIAQSR